MTTTVPGVDLARTVFGSGRIIPRHPDHDHQESVLQALDVYADQHVIDQTPVNTTRAYNGDWRVWRAFTTDIGVHPYTVRESLFTTFVVWLEETKGSAPNTIDRRLTGVTVSLRDYFGITVVPKGITVKARRALRGYKRRQAEKGIVMGRGSAPAMPVEDLALICQAQPISLAGLRTRALLTLQFGMAGRQSEPGSLLLTDVDDRNPAYLDVNLRYGKTGGRAVTIAAGQNPATCPVTAWRQWKRTAQLVDGPAFRAVDRHGNLGTKRLSGWAVNEIIIGATTLAGIETHYTGHSLRSGLVTAAWKAGHDDKTITDQTGHVPGSTQVQFYKQADDRHKNNATQGLGL